MFFFQFFQFYLKKNLYIYIYIYLRLKIQPNSVKIRSQSSKFFVLPSTGFEPTPIDTLQHHLLSLTSSALYHSTTSTPYFVSNFNYIANIIKELINLRFVPHFGLIFDYSFNSRKVLATPLYLEVSVPYQEGERSCICLLVSIDLTSFIVPTVRYFLFCFSFYYRCVLQAQGPNIQRLLGRRFSANPGRIISHKLVHFVVFCYNFRLRLFMFASLRSR